jgi:hypothetical protein
MKKISYRSKSISDVIVPKGEPCLITPPSGEEGLSASSLSGEGGRGGIGRGLSMLGENVSPPVHKEEELQEFVPKVRPKSRKVKYDSLMELLLVLADGLDGSKFKKDTELVKIADFMIEKIAEQKNKDYSRLLMDVLIKVSNSDAINTNQIISDAVKLYSRSVVIEFRATDDMDQAKLNAYQKTIRRINEVLR